MTGIRFSPRVLLAAVAVGTILTVKTANECHNTLLLVHIAAPFTPCVLFAFVVWFWWVAVAAVLWQLGTRHRRIGPLPLEVLGLSWTGALLHLAASAIVAMAHMEMLKQTVIHLAPYWPQWGRAYFSLGCITGERFGIDLAIYGFIYVCASSIRAQLNVNAATVQKLDLERELSRAQLHVLQAQLEPHFLFNSLNAVASLVDLNRNKEAANVLSHLNTILRTALSRGASEKVPLTDELRVIESYLAIQHARFADRLQVTLDIKHGIAPMENGGLLELSVRRIGEMLWLRVRDNGSFPARPAAAGYGIGMRSTHDRLGFIYPGRYSIAAGKRSTGGYEVTIQIPFERQLV
jgi:hypothetical protein